MKNTKNTVIDDIKVENEILRMQLAAEFGMQFNHEPDMKLSPFIEREWLKSIQRFEKAYAANKMESCYKAVGEPAYLPVDQLNDEQLTTELRRLIDLLSEKNIVVDYISDISDREIYSFITDKLFKEDILIFPGEGVVTHFTFSEFYPEE